MVSIHYGYHFVGRNNKGHSMLTSILGSPFLWKLPLGGFTKLKAFRDPLYRFPLGASEKLFWEIPIQEWRAQAQNQMYPNKAFRRMRTSVICVL